MGPIDDHTVHLAQLGSFSLIFTHLIYINKYRESHVSVRIQITGHSVRTEDRILSLHSSHQLPFVFKHDTVHFCPRCMCTWLYLAFFFSFEKRNLGGARPLVHRLSYSKKQLQAGIMKADKAGSS